MLLGKNRLLRPLLYALTQQINFWIIYFSFEKNSKTRADRRNSFSRTIIESGVSSCMSPVHRPNRTRTWLGGWERSVAGIQKSTLQITNFKPSRSCFVWLVQMKAPTVPKGQKIKIDQARKSKCLRHSLAYILTAEQQDAWSEIAWRRNVWQAGGTSTSIYSDTR